VSTATAMHAAGMGEPCANKQAANSVVNLAFKGRAETVNRSGPIQELLDREYLGEA